MTRRWPHRRGTFATAILILAATLDVGGTAFAQMPKKTPPSLSEMLKGDAKDAYEEARGHFKSGDFAGSLRALQRAQQLSPNPRLFWNMAACEKKLGQYAKAIAYVRKYLAAGGGVLSDDEQREANDFVTAMRTLVGSVTVTSPTDGVQLYVDDELVGATPFASALVVDAGTRHLRFTRAGYKDGARTESVPAGGTAAWSLEMDRDAREGHLVVTTGSSESIWVDGKLMGRGEWGGSVPSGVHTVLVTGSGKKSREQSIALRDSDVKIVDLHLQGNASNATWLWVSGGVLLVAGAVVGGYFLLKPTSSTPDAPKGTLGTFIFP